MSETKLRWEVPPRPASIEDIRFFDQSKPPAAAETRDMAETLSPPHAETIMEVGPDGVASVRDPERTIAVDPRPMDPASAAAMTAGVMPAGVMPAGAAQVREQLARLEDKTARVEEKLARSEAAMQRVVDRFEVASARMGEVALATDLSAVRGDVVQIGRRVRSLPGVTALILTSLVTALLAAAFTALALRYIPGLLVR